MDNAMRNLPARMDAPPGDPPAFGGDPMPMDDFALRFETHWSRIFHYDLFAPARRGSGGEVDDSANDD